VDVKRMKAVVVALVVVAVVLIVALRDREPPADMPEGDVLEEEIGRGIQSVTLVFADRTASGTVEERREVAVPEDRAGRAKRILSELAEGPSESGVRTLPYGTRVLSVFFDERGGVFVDFSRELVDNHPGGSTGELFTIRSVVQTLAANFRDIESVRFLVEGEEIETIAGHIDASVPFLVGNYR
jgi:spore germination protein GerM